MRKVEIYLKLNFIQMKDIINMTYMTFNTKKNSFVNIGVKAVCIRNLNMRIKISQ